MNISNTSILRDRECYLDVETTGLNPETDHILQLGGLLCGKEFLFYCRPPEPEKIPQKILDLLGVTVEEIKNYPDPLESFFKFITLLKRFRDPRSGDQNTKIQIYAFNAHFDMDFLYRFFDRYSPLDRDGMKTYYIANFFRKTGVCVMQAYIYGVTLGLFERQDRYRLENLRKLHNIEITKDHNALEDCKATKELNELIRRKHGDSVVSR